MSLINESSFGNNRPIFETQNTYDSNRKTDYEKRLQEVQMERSSYDKSIGFRTPEVIVNKEIPGTSNGTNNGISNGIMPPLSQKIHPSIINMFKQMDANKREVLKRTQFQLYQSIINEINASGADSLETTQKIMSEINESENGDYEAMSGIQVRERHERTDGHDGHERTEGHERNNAIIDIDFRNDLIDCKDCRYTVSIPGQPKYNVIKLQLTGITINQCYNLEHEPYIFLSIENIKGNHENGVFGKLVLKKIVNGFMIYTPENAVKTFNVPTKLHYFNIILLNHQYKKIILNRIPVVKIKKTENLLLITSATKHYLCVDDKINMYNISSDNVAQCYVFTIIEIDGNTFTVATSKEVAHILKGAPDLVFEKINIKLSMTFEYENIT